MIISDCTNNNSDSLSIQVMLNPERPEGGKTYFLSPRCLTSLESERGGLLILDAISLLKTVFAKVESVLLAKNLKSYIHR